MNGASDVETLVASADAKTARADADWAGAAADIEQALRLEPGRADLLRRLADCRRCLGDYAGAVAVLDRWVEAAPREAGSYAARANMRWHRRDYAGAADDAKRALELEPRGGGALQALAEAQRGAGDLAAAAAAADALLARDPRGSRHVVRAKIRLQAGELAEGLRDLEAALESDPRSSKAWGWKGVLLRRQGRFSESLDCLETAVGLDSRSAWLTFLRGELRRQQGDLEGSWSDIVAAARLDPHASCDFDMLGAATAPWYRDPANAWVQGWVGETLKWKKEPARALEHLDLSIEKAPDVYWSLLWRGELHLLEGRSEEAERDLRRAAELHPGLAQAREWLREAVLRREAPGSLEGLDHEGLWDDASIVGRRYAPYLAPRTRTIFAALNRRALSGAVAALEGRADADSLAKRGRLQWLSGADEAARASLEAAYALAPGDPKVQYWLGAVEASRDAVRAVALLKEALNADAAHGWPRLTLAAVHLQLGQWRECLSQADAFLAAGPALPAAGFLRACALTLLGRGDEAQAEAARLIERFPASIAGYEARSRARLQSGDLPGAFSDHYEVRARDPDVRFMGLELLGTSTSLGSWDDKWRLPLHLARVEEALGRHPEAAFLWSERAEMLRDPEMCRFDEALEAYRKAEALAPEQAWLQAHMARAEGQILGPEASMARLDRAVALDPGCGWIRAWRGELQRRLKRETAALEDLDAAILRMPWYGYAHAWRGGLLFSMDRAPQALAALDTALDLRLMSPALEATHFTRHLVRRSLGDLSGALEDLTVAFLLDPKYAWVGGVAPASADDYSAGLAQLDRLLSEGSGDPWAWAWRGFTRLQAGDLEGAQEDLSQARLLAPQNAWVAAWSALAARQADGPAAAVGEATRALELDAEQPLAASLVAEALESEGKLNEALQLLGRCLSRSGTSASLFVRRAGLLLKLERPADAAADLRRALNLNRKYGEARALLARALLESGDARGAWREADAALESQPASALARLARALARGRCGDLEGQLADMKAAYAADPGLFAGADGETMEALRS